MKPEDRAYKFAQTFLIALHGGAYFEPNEKGIAAARAVLRAIGWEGER